MTQQGAAQLLLFGILVVNLAAAQNRIDLPVGELNAKYRLFGRLGKPLGDGRHRD